MNNIGADQNGKITAMGHECWRAIRRAAHSRQAAGQVAANYCDVK
ncbi:MAG: hypothetical protein ABI821_06660 [Pseudomonadota bacterium]